MLVTRTSRGPRGNVTITETWPEDGVLVKVGSNDISQSQIDDTIEDHGLFTGLTDDDHPQYLLADGTRATDYLDFETVASLPATVTVGRIIRLASDNRLYYGIGST